MTGLIIIFFILAVVIVANLDSSDDVSKRIDIADHLSKLQNFNATYRIIGRDGAGLAVDENRNKICLIKYSNGEVSLDVIPYSDLFGFLICQNDATVTGYLSDRPEIFTKTLKGGIGFSCVYTYSGGATDKETSNYDPARKLRLWVNSKISEIHEISYLQNTYSKKHDDKDIIYSGLLKTIIWMADGTVKDHMSGRLEGLHDHRHKTFSRFDYSEEDALAKLKKFHYELNWFSEEEYFILRHLIIRNRRF